jgi:hypothetical protein
MTRRLRIQVAFVFALIILVGWPKFRPVRAVTIWKTQARIAPQPALVIEDPRFQPAAYEAAGVTAWPALDTGAAIDDAITAVSLKRATRRSSVTQAPEIAFALKALGSRLNAIVGRARTALNTPVPYGRLLLRNARSGQVAKRATADQEGRFLFVDIGPSNYIAELVGADGSVIAASELVTVADGDLEQVTIRVGADGGLLAVFGTFFEATADEPVDDAVATGARQVTEPETTISPQL